MKLSVFDNQKERSKKHYQNNKELYKQRAKKWATENPEKRKVICEQNYDKNKELYKANRDLRRKINPEDHKKLGHERRLKLLGIQEVKIYGIDFQVRLQILRHGLNFPGFCLYCFEIAECVDHFIPLCKGGTHICTNTVPCCNRCNLKKGTKLFFTIEEVRKYVGINLQRSMDY